MSRWKICRRNIFGSVDVLAGYRWRWMARFKLWLTDSPDFFIAEATGGTQ